MHSSANELEQIVRVVMQRLAAGRDLMAGVAEMAEDPAAATELTLSDRLVTTHVIEGRLEGKRVVRVGARTIVTPAVTDLLRAKQIQLIRGSQTVTQRMSSPNQSAGPRQSALPKRVPERLPAQAANAPRSAAPNPSATAHAPVLVCGSAIWFNSLNRHLCPKQAVVEACEDSAALQLVERHLSRGGKRVVWLSKTPFAAAAVAGRGAQAVAVQLPSLAELSAALEQAKPQVVIVDAQRWTVAAIGNLVRSLARGN